MTINPPVRSRLPAQPAIAHLAQNEAFQAVSARVDVLVRTQRILDEHWAALKLTVMAIRHEDMLIGTPNAAVAAKCRQFVPSIIARLKPLHPGLGQLKFRPRSARAAAVSGPDSHKQLISADALAAMNQALVDMPEGPVRDAMARMLERRR